MRPDVFLPCLQIAEELLGPKLNLPKDKDIYSTLAYVRVCVLCVCALCGSIWDVYGAAFGGKVDSVCACDVGDHMRATA